MDCGDSSPLWISLDMIGPTSTCFRTIACQKKAAASRSTPKMRGEKQ